MKLYIESKSKTEKFIIIKENRRNKSYRVSSDILEDLKAILKSLNLSLFDFEDFISVPSESFTGYRQAVNITNTLKHYVKGVSVKCLSVPKYHKEPNVIIKS